MSTSNRPSTTRLALLVAVTAVAATAVAFVAPSAQAATCGSRTTGTPFSKFGDSNQYFLAPSGSFESGASGWALQNGSAAAGNDAFNLNSASDKQSLKLTGSATSPSFCITRDDPVLRFAAKSVTTPGANGNYSQLNVSIVVRNAAGSQATFFLGAIAPQGNGGWFIVPQLRYGNLLDSWLFGSDGTGTATMQLQFTVAGQGGTWSIDDVYVDPFMGK
jgi:hypothetical protein